jgi:hypothetical protein
MSFCAERSVVAESMPYWNSGSCDFAQDSDYDDEDERENDTDTENDYDYDYENGIE